MIKFIKNKKLIISIIYLIILSIFIILSSYNLSKDSLFELLENFRFERKSHEPFYIFILVIAFFLITIIWTFFLGFGTPINIISGFLFGTIFGSFLAILANTIGSTVFYKTFDFILDDKLYKQSKKKYRNLIRLLKKDEIFYFFIIRLIFIIPQQVCNVLPLFVKMKVKTFFFITLLGTLPGRIIVANIGDSFYQSINYSSSFSNGKYIEVFYSFSILLIFIIFGLLVYKFINKKIN